MNRSAIALWLGLAVVVVLVALAATGRRAGDDPLDPDSSGPRGARALVDLIDSFAAATTVTDAIPSDGVDTALLLVDNYDSAQRRRLVEWVERGGVLLVADPASALTPVGRRDSPDPDFDADGELIAGPDLAPRRDASCGEPALADVDELSGLTTRYPQPAGTSCFGGGIVVELVGAGAVVSLGGPWPLTNAYLGAGDNAVFAVAVLAPSATTRAAVLSPELFGPTDDSPSLLSLVSNPVWLLIVQIGVALALFAAWRARRLGSPVAEPQLVTIEGVELTEAVGRFLARSREPGHAAGQLRKASRARLARLVAWPDDADLAAVVAAHVGADPREVEDVLHRSAVADDGELIDLARRLDQLEAACGAAAGPFPMPSGGAS